MKNSKAEVRKWIENEKITWGEAKIEFFIKDDAVLFGNLKLPPRASTPLDQGHPNGEYIFIRDGQAITVLLKENKEISRTGVKAGESVFIPAGIDHQTINSGNSELSVIFFIDLK